MSNRIRLVTLSIHSWMVYIIHGQMTRCVNMPRDARVERVAPCNDLYARDIVIWLSSPEFDEVPEGGVIPEFQLRFEHVAAPIAAIAADLRTRADDHDAHDRPHHANALRDYADVLVTPCAG